MISLMEWAMQATHQNANECVCKGSGIIIADDDHTQPCPYHWIGNQICPDCRQKMKTMPYMMEQGKFRDDDCPNIQHETVFLRIVEDK